MLRRIVPLLALFMAVVPGFAEAAPAQQAASGNAPAAQIDPLVPDAQGWLTDLVRINTSVPSAPMTAPAMPGSAANPALAGSALPTAPTGSVAPDTTEVAAAKYVLQILQKENIASEILQIVPGRAVVVGRIQSGPLPNPATALLLMAHLDVTGVNKGKWSTDPFGGVAKNGYIYGRGVLDDKGMLVANLAAIVALKRSGVRLNRDVIFLADGGSEPGNPAGMKVLADRFWDKVACGFAINEGGNVVLQGDKVQYVGIGDGEKVPYDITVTAAGTPGPAAIPRPDNAVTHLAAAIAKISTVETKPQMIALTSRYFEQLAPVEDDDTGKWMRALDTERFSLAVIRLTEISPMWGAMLRDTIAPTELDAGFAPDAVASEAHATLHIQLIPGNPLSTLIDQLEKMVNDPKVKFQINPDAGVAAPESSLDSALYQSISRAASRQFSGAAVLPMLTPDTTGSAELRLRNVQTYGLLPFPLSEADMLSREGDDERLPLASFRTGLEFLYRTVYDFAATR